MPKVELEFDLDELEDAEYTEGQFSRYSGEIPPADTILRGYVSKMWLSETSNKDEMLIAIFTAAENEGDLEEYNGWEAWEYLAMTAGAKFRWKPFIDAFGIKLGDIKNKLKLEPEDDNVGAPITHIAAFEVGGDASWCRVLTAREKYQGEWRGKVGSWLPYDEDEEAEPEPAAAPTRSRASAARGSGAGKSEAAKPAARGSRTRATEAVEEAPEEVEEAPATPARRGGRTAPPARTTAPAAPAPARRGTRGRAGAAVDNEPPF
jgi:hypothetical protein